MLRSLTVPDGLCLMEVPESMRWNPKVVYVYSDYTVQFWLPDWLPPPMPSEKIKMRMIAEQVCVAHQHRVVMDSGLKYDYQYAWSKTPEGIDFMRAVGWTFNGVGGNRKYEWSKNGVVQEFLDPSGQAAQACAHRYLGTPLSAIEQSWAERWLPLPPGK
ncbi:MAG: hypothetical protein Q7R48_02070 [bacterium]|nr:hypothetical protein [bacterium]